MNMREKNKLIRLLMMEHERVSIEKNIWAIEVLPWENSHDESFRASSIQLRDRSLLRGRIDCEMESDM